MVCTPEEVIREAAECFGFEERIREIYSSEKVYDWLETSQNMQNFSEVLAVNHGINPYGLLYTPKGKPNPDVTFEQIANGIEKLLNLNYSPTNLFS
jgi:hypothetical protein